MKHTYNKIKLFFILLITVFFVISCSQKKGFNIIITNPTELNLQDIFLSTSIDSTLDSYSLFDGDSVLTHQFLYSENKELGFVINLDPGETKLLILKKNDSRQLKKIKSRTYAELSMKPGNVYFEGKFRGDRFVNVTKLKVPSIHTDHDALFKYEGPGWESEKVGYRFYLDWRNAIDIFGKKINELVLSNVGVHDTVAKDDSYHQMQDWGMDIFKVGSSLGIGSIGMMYENKVFMVSKTDSIYFEIPENGPLRSSVRTSYFGWQVGENKYDLVSTLSITAGSRLTKCEIDISIDPENIVTGLAKFEGTEFIRSTQNDEWTYMALYGNQTLVSADDKLGIAVFYRVSNLIEMTEDELSHIVKLKPENGKLEYYFCAAWEQEPDGIKNRNDFIKYLDDTMEYLNNPPVVTID